MTRQVHSASTADDALDELDWVDRELIVSVENVPTVIVSLVRFSHQGSAAQLDGLFAPELDVDDRRQRTDTPMTGRDQVIRTLAAFGPNVFDVRLLAVRGDGLGAVRIMFERTEGGIADMVVLVEGRAEAAIIDRLEIHDTAAFPDVVRSLSGAHFALLPPDQQAVLGVSAGVLAAIIGRELDILAQLLRDDFVYRDHRESMPTQLGRDDSIALLSSILDESPDTIDYAPEILEITPAGLLTTHTQTTLDRLGRTDVDVIVMGVRNGQLRAFEVYELVQLERARRLLASWR